MVNCPVGFSYQVAVLRSPGLIRNRASAVLPLSGEPPQAAVAHDKQLWLLLGSGVVRPASGNGAGRLWCASKSGRR